MREINRMISEGCIINWLHKRWWKYCREKTWCTTTLDRKTFYGGWRFRFQSSVSEIHRMIQRIVTGYLDLHIIEYQYSVDKWQWFQSRNLFLYAKSALKIKEMIFKSSYYWGETWIKANLFMIYRYRSDI